MEVSPRIVSGSSLTTIQHSTFHFTDSHSAGIQLALYATARMRAGRGHMNKSENEVRAAIERCLEACYQADSPVVKVAEFTENLRAEGWAADDIRRVELVVLRMLTRLVSPEDDLKRQESD